MTDKEMSQTMTTEENNKQQEEKERKTRMKKRKAQTKHKSRRLSGWQKMLFVFALFLFCIISGLFVGYVIIGDPDDVLSIYHWRTWVDLYNFIRGT